MIGSASSLGLFVARLGLDSSDYSRGMNAANGMNQTFGKGFLAFVTNPLTIGIALFSLLTAGAAVAGRAMIKMSNETLENAERIERLNQSTGASVQLLTALEKQLQLAGAESEKAGTGLKVFTRTIAEAREHGSPFADVLRELNVNFQAMDSLDEIFKEVMQGLFDIEDAGRRAYLASKLFGEEDSFAIVNAVGGGRDAVVKMVEDYTRLGFILETDVNARFAQMNTHLGVTKQAIEGIKQNAVNQFLIGLAGGIDITDDKIVGLAESINAQLSPSMRELGRTVPPLVEDLLPLVTVLSDLLDLTVRITEEFGNFNEAAAIDIDTLLPGTPAQDAQGFFGSSSPWIIYARGKQFQEDPSAYFANHFSTLD